MKGFLTFPYSWHLVVQSIIKVMKRLEKLILEFKSREVENNMCKVELLVFMETLKYECENK
jgi:hypothetical protein